MFVLRCFFSRCRFEKRRKEILVKSPVSPYQRSSELSSNCRLRTPLTTPESSHSIKFDRFRFISRSFFFISREITKKSESNFNSCTSNRKHSFRFSIYWCFQASETSRLSSDDDDDNNTKKKQNVSIHTERKL